MNDSNWKANICIAKKKFLNNGRGKNNRSRSEDEEA